MQWLHIHPVAQCSPSLWHLITISFHYSLSSSLSLFILSFYTTLYTTHSPCGYSLFPLPPSFLSNQLPLSPNLSQPHSTFTHKDYKPVCLAANPEEHQRKREREHEKVTQNRERERGQPESDWDIKKFPLCCKESLGSISETPFVCCRWNQRELRHLGGEIVAGHESVKCWVRRGGENRGGEVLR